MSEPRNIIVLSRVPDHRLLKAVREWNPKKYPRRLQAISDELARRKQERRAA